jgi:tripartite-type tricarboxylate transporter receptor subunit TctC
MAIPEAHDAATPSRRGRWGSASAVVGALLIALCAMPAAGAQEYPTRPIRMIIPYPAGGSVDVLGRAIADRLQPLLGQAVVPENKVGATGTIAHQLVARRRPTATPSACRARRRWYWHRTSTRTFPTIR